MPTNATLVAALETLRLLPQTPPDLSTLGQLISVTLNTTAVTQHTANTNEGSAPPPDTYPTQVSAGSLCETPPPPTHTPATNLHIPIKFQTTKKPRRCTCGGLLYGANHGNKTPYSCSFTNSTGHKCENLVAYHAALWRCFHPDRRCGAGICKTCIKQLPIASLTEQERLLHQYQPPPPPTLVPTSGPATALPTTTEVATTTTPSGLATTKLASGYYMPTDCRRIDDLLSQCPPVNPLPTPTYPPRNICTRFAGVYVQLLIASMCMWHTNDTITQCRMARLTQLYPVLTLRSPTTTKLTSAQLQARVQSAHHGEWEGLLTDYLNDVRAITEPSAGPPNLTNHFTKCITKILGGCLKTAKQLLLRGPDSVIPSEATATAILSKFTTEPTSAEDTAKLTHLCHTALHQQNAPNITMRDVKQRIWNLPAGSATGRSGTRTTHIAACTRVPGGTRAWHQWCRAWSTGRVPACVVHIWAQPIFTPIPKVGGALGEIRPIALFDTPFKLATGTTNDSLRSDIIGASGGYQYGAGKSSGAQQLLSDATGLSVALPNHAFVSLDATNAYGNMSRVFTLQAIITKAPRLAPIVALQWSYGPTTAWVEVAPGVWVEHLIYDGLFQGECLAGAEYCIGASLAIDNFHTTAKTIAPELYDMTSPTPYAILMYVDDIFMCSSISSSSRTTHQYHRHRTTLTRRPQAHGVRPRGGTRSRVRPLCSTLCANTEKTPHRHNSHRHTLHSS
jgi:hypothetical protein